MHRACKGLLLSLLAGLSLGLAQPVHAQKGESRQPPVWPEIYAGSPEKVAVSLNAQQHLGKRDVNLVESLGVGIGGARMGIGFGRFQQYFGSGWALRLTGARTYRTPLGTGPNETFVGLEAEGMFASIAVKAGPLVRVAGADGRHTWLISWGVGIGFL